LSLIKEVFANHWSVMVRTVRLFLCVYLYISIHRNDKSANKIVVTLKILHGSTD